MLESLVIEILSPFFWTSVSHRSFSPLALEAHPKLQEFRREPDLGETVLQAPVLGGEGGTGCDVLVKMPGFWRKLG